MSHVNSSSALTLHTLSGSVQLTGGPPMHPLSELPALRGPVRI